MARAFHRRRVTRSRRSDPVRIGGSALRNPRPGRAKRMRLDHAGPAELRVFRSTIATWFGLGVIFALPNGLYGVVIYLALCSYLIPMSLACLCGKRPAFKIKISADRLRVYDERRTRPEWVDYRRREVDSVIMRDGEFSVSDRSGHTLIHYETGRKARTLRRVLERQHWLPSSTAARAGSSPRQD